MTEHYESDQSGARDFRVIQRPDGSEYVLEWQIMDGTIMTVTSIKVSREGLLKTAEILAKVAEIIGAASQQKREG